MAPYNQFLAVIKSQENLQEKSENIRKHWCEL